MISITFLCEQCWQQGERGRREREEEEKQILVQYKEELACMLDSVQQTHLMERVPIACAVDEFMAEIEFGYSCEPSSPITARMRGNLEKIQRDMIHGLSKELQIVKIRNRYFCNKQRVDAMDFKLWHARLSHEIWDPYV